jgi:predicted nucleic acid-binding Zn ribbon protein
MTDDVIPGEEPAYLKLRCRCGRAADVYRQSADDPYVDVPYCDACYVEAFGRAPFPRRGTH